MKIKYITIAAIAMAMSLHSCYDLDRVPADQLSSKQFYKNEEHAKEAMMAVYSQMQEPDVFGLQFSLDGLEVSLWDMTHHRISLYNVVPMT